MKIAEVIPPADQQRLVALKRNVASAKQAERQERFRQAMELWLNLGDGVNQAANLISGATSIPSLNFTPLMTFGN